MTSRAGALIPLPPGVQAPPLASKPTMAPWPSAGAVLGTAGGAGAGPPASSLAGSWSVARDVPRAPSGNLAGHVYKV